MPLVGKRAGAAGAVRMTCSLNPCTQNPHIVPCAVLWCVLQANCKSANDSKDMSRCILNLTRLPYIPGFFLISVDGVQPAAAQPYDLARARFGGRPAPECAVLSEDRTVAALDEGVKTPNAVATGAAALPTGPFCGMQFVRNYTLTFEGMDCENAYAFNATATATPVSTGAKPVSGQLAFDVICPED